MKKIITVFIVMIIIFSRASAEQNKLYNANATLIML